MSPLSRMGLVMVTAARLPLKTGQTAIFEINATCRLLNATAIVIFAVSFKNIFSVK